MNAEPSAPPKPARRTGMRWSHGCIVAASAFLLLFVGLLILGLRACQRQQGPSVAAGPDLVLTANDPARMGTQVTVDPQQTTDGGGSLRIQAAHGALVTIGELDGLQVVSGETLWCDARLRCQDAANGAFLEMWCEFTDDTRLPVKGLDQVLRGTQDWRAVRLSLPVHRSAKIRRVLVNAAVGIAGVLWVDDLRFSVGPSAPPATVRELGSLPCNDLAQVKTVVSVDRKVTADGNGSLKVAGVQGVQFTVADQGGFSVTEGSTLWCVARVRGAGIKQQAYLEMWCEFDKKGRAFSKGLGQILQGDTDWVEVRLPMMVNQPATLNRALVNVVMEGPGTVWVDEVRFSTVPSRTTLPR